MAELVYLVEKGRLPQAAYDEPAESLADPEHVFAEAVFTIAIVQSMRQISRAEVPDMPRPHDCRNCCIFRCPGPQPR